MKRVVYRRMAGELQALPCPSVHRRRCACRRATVSVIALWSDDAGPHEAFYCWACARRAGWPWLPVQQEEEDCSNNAGRPAVGLQSKRMMVKPNA